MKNKQQKQHRVILTIVEYRELTLYYRAKYDITPETCNYNGYSCSKCKKVTVVSEDLDFGTTPMLVNCPICGTKATSLMYKTVMNEKDVNLHFYRPNYTQYLYLSRDAQEHIVQGGLLMRWVTPVKKVQEPITVNNTSATNKFANLMDKFRESLEECKPIFTSLKNNLSLDDVINMQLSPVPTHINGQKLGRRKRLALLDKQIKSKMRGNDEKFN